MTGEWSTATIGELAEKVAMGPFGSSIKVETFVPTGVPVISGQHLRGFKLEESDFNFVTPEHADQLRNANVQRGDIIFTHAGNIGQVAYIPDNSKYERYVISQRQFYMRCNRTRIIPEFIVYYFKTPEGHHKLLANTSQVGVPSIAQPVTYLRTIELAVPPLPEQRAIAHILGTLDDKMELNRRMNETLEAMAQAIFKSWFMDATESGIPKGWKVAPIGDCVGVFGGSTPSTNDAMFWDGEIPFATPKDLASLTAPVLLETERRITEAGLSRISSGLLPRGTVLLSSRAPIGYLAISEIPVTVNQGFIAMVCDRILPNHYVLHWARQNMDLIIGNANGTTFLEISKRNFRPIPVIVPPPDVLEAFVGRIEPLYARVVSNLCESRTLAALRDALLPKLLSGEIRVRNAEKFGVSIHNDQ